jgi:single-stranded-DNA-specific exonuclease
MADAVGEILEAVDAGAKVTVYGDFDVDGVAATTIMVRALRDIGAKCDWFIPDRMGEGYGLNDEAIASIAARGSSLIVTVDCGVTAVAEVALARSLGLGIVVTDHHRPGPELPDCTILHPVVSAYPFEHLCGAGVAYKLACALREARGLPGSALEDDLDLVALATVADVMPLVGENRRLVREGVTVARRAERPGMKALMSQCRVEPAQLSATDFGFRLGPRINAAGRMYRADAGVELFLADSPERAAEIAEELNRVNSERRRIESEVESAARAARRELDDSSPCSLVLAGEGWHAGVVGIVAAKMVREFGLPTVIISVDGDHARGSARSVPGLDLHDALSEVASLLEAFGGHAAAAGLQLDPNAIPEFRQAFERAVVARIGPEPKTVPVPVDAFAGGDEIGLGLAEELAALEPCGKENPVPVIVLPGARICDVQEMGEGRHCRFTVVSGSARARGVSFGRTGFGVDEDTRVDVLAELSVNHWNGSIEPQLRVLDVMPHPDPAADPLPGCPDDQWWDRFERSWEEVPGPAVPGSASDVFPGPDPAVGAQAIHVLECPAEVALAELASSREPLLVVTADCRRRWTALGGAEGVRLLAGLSAGDHPTPVAIWAGSPRDESAGFIDACRARIGFCDYTTLVGAEGGMRPEGIVLLFDPPASATEKQIALDCARLAIEVRDPAGVEFAVRASGDRHALTPHLRAMYRDLKARDQAAGRPLRQALAGPRELPHSPEMSATLLRILVEAGAATTDGSGAARRAGVVSSGKVELGTSPTFRRQSDIHKEQIAFLRQSRQS